MKLPWLFMLLALGFALAAAWRSLRGARLAARTWWILAFAFAAVAAWLQSGAGRSG